MAVAEYEDSEILSARQYLRLVSDARARQIQQVLATIAEANADVERTRARLVEAEAAVLLARREHELANARRAAATELLALAERPLEDDPAVRRHMQTLHPLRRVPLEVLGLIFTYAAESSEAMSVKRIQRLPYRLALVSRRWREVALQTPAMWRFIAVRLDKVTSILEYDLHLLYLHTSRERAGGCALDVTIEYLGDKAPANRHHATKLVEDIYTLMNAPVRKLDLYMQHGVSDIGKVMLYLKPDALEELVLLSSSPSQFNPLFPADMYNLKAARACLEHFVDPFASVYQQVTTVGIEPVLPGAQKGVQARNTALANVFAAFPCAAKMEIHVAREGQCDSLQSDALAELAVVSLGGFEPLSIIYKFPALRTASVDITAVKGTANYVGLRHLMSAGALAAVHTFELAARMTLDEKLATAMRGMTMLREVAFVGGLPDAAFFKAMGSFTGGVVCESLTTMSFLPGEPDEGDEGPDASAPFNTDELLACIDQRNLQRPWNYYFARIKNVTVEWPGVPADFGVRLKELVP